MVKRPGELYVWFVCRNIRWTQNFLEAWSSQWACTAMHSRNYSTVVDLSRTIEQSPQVLPRILDMLILQDKTLFCAFEDNFKQNGVKLLSTFTGRPHPNMAKI